MMHTLVLIWLATGVAITSYIYWFDFAKHGISLENHQEVIEWRKLPVPVKMLSVFVITVFMIVVTPAMLVNGLLNRS